MWSAGDPLSLSPTSLSIPFQSLLAGSEYQCQVGTERGGVGGEEGRRGGGEEEDCGKVKRKGLRTLSFFFLLSWQAEY